MHVLIKLEIPIFEFKDLGQEAKQKAIEEHFVFLLSIPIEVETEDGEIVPCYEFDLEESDVIESLETNKYYFYKDGELAPVTRYTGNHPKSGKREFNYKGITVEF